MSNDEVNKFKMKISVNGRIIEILASDNIKITRRIEPETVKYFLNIQNREICEIKANSVSNRYAIYFEPIGKQIHHNRHYLIYCR